MNFVLIRAERIAHVTVFALRGGAAPHSLSEHRSERAHKPDRCSRKTGGAGAGSGGPNVALLLRNGFQWLRQHLLCDSAKGIYAERPHAHSPALSLFYGEIAVHMSICVSCKTPKAPVRSTELRFTIYITRRT